MWLTSVYLKTLRDFRIAILGWGVGIGLLIAAVLSAVPELVATPAARATLVSLATSFTWIAEPVAVDTAGGYATWKYGFTILVMALWPILVASRMLRGEEERGILDTLLSLPRSRTRVALEKLAAMWTALLLMALLIGVLASGGGSAISADFGLGEGLLFGLNLSLISGVFGSLALFIAQFTREQRSAAGITGGLLLVAIMVDMVHRVFPATDWISRLSPVYYYNLSKPLVPSYGSDATALLVMALLSAILSGAAVWLFLRRDIGSTVALPGWLRLPERKPRPEQLLPVNDWSLKSVFSRSLATIAAPTFWWTLAIAGFAGWMVVLVKQTQEQLRELYEGSPLLRDLIVNLGGGGPDSNASLLSFMYLILPVLLMAFAVTQASRWATDEEDGQHELVLATPQSRLTVLLARFGAVTTATVFIALVTLALTTLAAATSGLTLDSDKLVGASLSIIPMGLLMAAIGYLFSGWLRAAVDTGLLSFLLLLWFTITFIGPELGWPDEVLQLSAFYYYGRPLIEGVSFANMLLVLGITGAALVIASARFVRKDIGR